MTAGPHSGTTFGSMGVATCVIVGSTVAMARLPRLRRLPAPLVAVGIKSPTAYVGHFVVQSALPMPSGPRQRRQSWVSLLLFVLGAIACAAIWSPVFRRGPLEHLLNAATKPAKHIPHARPG